MKKKPIAIFLMLIVSGLMAVLVLLIGRIVIGVNQTEPEQEEYCTGTLSFLSPFANGTEESVTVEVDAFLRSGSIGCLTSNGEVNMDMTLIAPDGAEYKPEPPERNGARKFEQTQFDPEKIIPSSYSCRRTFLPGNAPDGTPLSFAPGLYTLRIRWLGCSAEERDAVAVIKHPLSKEETEKLQNIAAFLDGVEDPMEGLRMLLFNMRDEFPFPSEGEPMDQYAVARREDVNDFFIATLGIPFDEPEQTGEEASHFGFCRDGLVYVSYSDANFFVKILRCEETEKGKYAVTACICSAYDDSVIEDAFLFTVSVIEGYLGFRVEEYARIPGGILSPEQAPGEDRYGRRYIKDLTFLLEELDAIEANPVK